ARSQVAKARADYERIRAQYLGEDLGNYVSTTSSSSGGVYVDSEAARRQRVFQAETTLNALSRSLADREASYEEAIKGGVEQTTVFAMFTGRKYANLEVWDCGRKK